MKKRIYILFLLLVSQLSSSAQNCDPSTPVFNIDLTGQPNGTWISTPVQRNGLCCSSSNPDRCIQFNLTLDSAANGISFNIYSGAVPGGSMFYQINCGPSTAVGQPVCLTGAGPHIITFCKPGNNTNQYSITSISDPSLNGTRYVSQACHGLLVAEGLIESSIQWTSVPNNLVYNGYLNCSSGCDSVTISPPFNSSVPYIDYQVCGTVAGACVPYTFCDTIRVNFVNDLAVTINPANPTICFGGTNATFTAIGSGGLAPYSYQWNTGETTAAITKGVGTYVVTINDQMNCSIATDTVTVTALPSPISADAGLDGMLCLNAQSFQLLGTVIAATGGQWYGPGTFNPSSTNLNAQYTPSPAEILNGYADLTLITTGNFNCPADTDLIHILISPNPTPVISGQIQVCNFEIALYTTPYITGNTYQWSVTGGIIISANQNNISIQWTNTGNNQLSLIETSSSNCSTSDSIIVAVMPKPTPEISGSQLVCNFSSENYSILNPVTGNNYQWSITNGIFLDSTGSSVIANWQTTGSGNISVVETNSFGCDSSIFIPVNILNQPVPIITGSDTICQFSTSFYNTSFDSTYQYFWTVTGGNIISQNNNVIEINWTSIGTGSITLNVVNQNLCDSSVTFFVTIIQQPTPVIMGSAIICSGIINEYSVGGIHPGETIFWNVIGGSIQGSSSSDTIKVIWQSQETGELNAHVINSLGCDSTFIFTVIIIDQPMPVISGNDTICQFQTSVYSTAFDSTYQYYWNVVGGNIISQINNIVEINWTNIGTGSINVNVINQNLCDSAITYFVTILDKPTPEILGSNSICSNSLSEYYVTGVQSYETINWNIVGGTILGSKNNDTINVIWQSQGSGELTVNVTNPNGCDSLVTLNVTVLDGATPQLIGPNQLCKYDTSTYSVQFVNGHSYSWRTTGGIILGTETTNTIQVYWFEEGTATISVTETSSAGCDSTDNMDVNVSGLPLPTINSIPFVCQNATTVFYTNPVNNHSYEWTISGGTFLNGNQQSTISCKWNAVGLYNLSIQEINEFGCIAIENIPIQVMPTPNIAIAGNVFGCTNRSSAFTINETPGMLYQYSITGGIITSNTSGNIRVDWTSYGNNSLSVYAVDNSSGCNSQNSITVLVEKLPKPVVSAANFMGCPPLNVSFQNNADSSSYHYNWSFGEGLNSYEANPDHTYNVSGNFRVNVIATNNTGCIDSASADVVVFPEPESEFNIMNPGNIVWAEFQDVLLVNSSQGAYTYSWNFGNGDTSNNFEPPVFRYDKPGTYKITLEVINTWGCKSLRRKSIEVIVPEDIYVPNTFTPNGDSMNDYFSVAFKNINSATVSIFDRWGEKIFESADMNFKWDGFYKGRIIQHDVYIYTIDAVGYYGTPINKIGKLTVLY